MRTRLFQKVDADNANVKFEEFINDRVNFIAMKADLELTITDDAKLNAVLIHAHGGINSRSSDRNPA